MTAHINVLLLPVVGPVSVIEEAIPMAEKTARIVLILSQLFSSIIITR